MFRLTLLLCLLAPITVCADEPPFYLKSARRVLFLGDSNTYAGHYITLVDAYLRTRFPEQSTELFNLGLPSETVSGLSEPDHPFPRPHVHERLDRALEKIKPDVVVACYGMNDGIYYPPSAERLQKFQAGLKKLLEKVKKTGARLTLITSVPFDPVPLKKIVQPANASKFSWMKPYAGYDEALRQFAQWQVSLRANDLPVADAHSSVLRHLAAIRKDNPDYYLAGDGIHPSAFGHLLVARELLQTWHAPGVVDEVEIDATTKNVKGGKVTDLNSKGGSLTFHWTAHIPLWLRATAREQTEEVKRTTGLLNRQRLKVTGLPGKKYDLYEGEMRVGRFSAAELAKGVDLTTLDPLTTTKRAKSVFELVQKRQQVLSRAWLDEVGHQRPQTPKGKPLAEAEKIAAELTPRINGLVQPVELSLRLELVRE